MALLKIARMGHPVLLQRCEPVPNPGALGIRQLVANMMQTMEDASGVGSRFMAASIRRCRFDRADLMDALLADAVMDKASFEQANLYRADLGRSVGEDVNMSGANVRWARSLPKREPA